VTALLDGPLVIGFGVHVWPLEGVVHVRQGRHQTCVSPAQRERGERRGGRGRSEEAFAHCLS